MRNEIEKYNHEDLDVLVLYYTVLSGLSAICVVKVSPFCLVTGFSYYVMSCYLAINSEL